MCGRVTYNPTDIAEGYCAACHTWTRGCTCVWVEEPPGHFRHVRFSDQCPPHMGWHRADS